MSRQGFAGWDYQDFPSTSLNTIVSSATETSLWNVSLFSYIPSFDLRAGKAYMVCFGGIISAAVSPTVTIVPRYGIAATSNANLTLGTSSAVTVATLTAAPFYGQFVFGVRSLGVATSTSVLVGTGMIDFPGNAIATNGSTIIFGGSTLTTADFATNQGIGIGWIWSVATTSNTVTCQWAFLRSLN